jgi:opacity protein-like surface antigen
MFKIRNILMVLAGVLVAGSPKSALGAEAEPGWEFNLDVYLWAASTGGETGSGSTIDTDFSDVIKDLKLGGMAGFEARNGPWLIGIDAIGAELDDNRTAPGGTYESVDLKAWIVTPMVGWNLANGERGVLDFIVGARYLSLDTKLQIDAIKVEESSDFWDGVIGLKGDVVLAKHWFVPYYVDVGAGDSKLTWQAMAGIGYRFNETWALDLNYRYLSYEFDSGGAVDNFNLHGPLLGVKISF